MTGSTMVTVDVQRLNEDLRALLYERFRRAFLRRRTKKNVRPSSVIESVAHLFLFEVEDTRREIQKIIGEHVAQDRTLCSPAHNVYAPELLKSLVYDIGREAWAHRYNGPIQAELNVQSSQVTLHKIRSPNGKVHALTQPHVS
jgi:hypothetical protein